MTDQDHFGQMTRAIHAGETHHTDTRASSPAIHMSSSFVSDSVSGFSAHDMTDDSPYCYTRWGNPTVKMLEDKIAAMQGTEACLCTASGMAAASAIFLTFLSAGDHVIVSDISYPGVAEFVRDTLPRLGVEVSTVDMSHAENVAAAMRPNTRLIHSESPANPIMRLTDLAAISDIAHAGGALHSTDATFVSPIGIDATALGVDLVMHSITKYVCGHGDAVGGAVAASAELVKQMRIEANIHHGGILSPFNAWLIGRGAATLPLRMRAHEAGTRTVAEWLDGHKAVTSVCWPGLVSHPQHDLAQRQMRNFSGMLTFQVGDTATGERIANAMIEKLQVIHYAVSLGHHRSLIFWLDSEGLIDTSFKLTGRAAENYRAFSGDGIFRLSVGLEDPEDLIADLDRVL